MVAISGLTIHSHVLYKMANSLFTAHANENPAQKDMKSTVNKYMYIEEASENMKVSTKEKCCCSEPENCMTSPTTLCELPVIMENIRAECS